MSHKYLLFERVQRVFDSRRDYLQGFAGGSTQTKESCRGSSIN